MPSRTYRTLLALFVALLSALPAARSQQSTDSLYRKDVVLQQMQALYPGLEGDWAKRQLNRLSLEQQIGQLFMVKAWSGGRYMNQDEVEDMIADYQVGGIIFMQGGPQAQAQLAERYNKLSRLPLLISQDAEYGLAMRLDSTLLLPTNDALGALQNDSLVYAYGSLLAEQCKAVGVRVNFAPVVDVNSNPNNPVIGYRSFGEQKNLVARKGLMLMEGLQNNGVLSCAKHFPGHGDTDLDSHYDLPLLPYSRLRLDTLELHSFRALIRYGVQSIMVAHLAIPSLEPDPNRPASLSRNIVTGLLRQELGFGGLIFSDALRMQALTKHYEKGEIEAEALMAGNDVLLCAEDLEDAVEAIKKALQSGRLSRAQLEASVYRILLVKEWLNLHDAPYHKPAGLYSQLHSDATYRFTQNLYRQALTLYRSSIDLLPVHDLTQRMAYVEFNDYAEDELPSSYSQASTFERLLLRYGPMDTYHVSNELDSLPDSLLAALRAYDLVLIGCQGMSRRPNDRYGISAAAPQLVDSLAAEGGPKTVVTIFGPAYAGQYFKQADGLLVAYDRSTMAQQAAAEALMAGQAPLGQPSFWPPGYPTGNWRFYDETVQRLRHAPARWHGMSEDTLAYIDKLLQEFIKEEALPGASIVVVHGQDVVYARGFGKTEYTRRAPYADPYTTLYDLASVTKVASTTLVCMRLFEEGRIKLTQSIAEYFPELKGTPKEAIELRHLLLHNSGLPGWVPYYEPKAGGLDFETFLSDTPSEEHAVVFGPGKWASKALADSVFARILRVELKHQPGEEYIYSDLGMILLARILEQVLEEPIDTYTQREFYAPLGMNHTGFRPLAATWRSEVNIAPSGIDTMYRDGRIEGYVHDNNANLLGGVAGHAGLFSTGYDMAKLLLMLKNGGTYGGREYFDPLTVNYFTAQRYSDSRRGLGWDKPDERPLRSTPTTERASPLAYGHLGFTGTAVWVDPQHDLAIIILANRTWPDAENKLYSEEGVRTRIADLVYRALGIPKGGKAEQDDF